MSGDLFDIIQGNRETLTGTLHDPAATTGHVLTVQADKSIKAVAGGGGAAGVVVRGPFPFDFTQAVALAAGRNVYTPTPGDILLNWWIEVTTPFDGTTPKADIGQIDAGAWTDGGAFGNGVDGPIDLTQAWGQAWATDLLSPAFGPNLFDVYSEAFAGGGGTSLLTPARFITARNISLVACQGTVEPGGTPLDSAVGAGNVYLVTATPVAF